MTSFPADQGSKTGQPGWAQQLFPVIGAVFTVGVFGYLFHTVPLGKLILTVRELSKEGLIAFIILSFTGSVLRAWRYQLILRWSGFEAKTLPLFLITLVRNLCADLLPARLGTLIYIYLTHSRLKVPLSSATSSFALALFFDLVTLPVVLLLFVTFDSGLRGEDWILPVLSSLIVLLGALLWFLPTLLQSSISLANGLQLQFLRPLIKLASQMVTEIETLRDPKELMKLFTLSLLIRLSKYLSLILFLYALLIPLGYSPSELSFAKAFIGVLSSEVAASLPISGIAGFGLYEGTWAFTFRYLGLPGSIADLTALAHHLFTQVYGYLLGGFAMLLLLSVRFSPGKELSSSQSKSKQEYFIMKVTTASLLIALSLLLAQTRVIHKQEDVSPASSPKAHRYFSDRLPEEQALLFDSNLSGTFGIYILKKGAPEPTALANSKTLHQMYPDISPATGELVFAETRTTKRLEPGTIFIKSSATSSPVKLIENGTFPTFINNAKKILFERGRERVMVFDRTKETETQLFPFGRDGGKFKGAQIVKPRLSKSGRFLVFTSDKPKPWHAWLVDLKKRSIRLLDRACEPVVHPSEQFGLFIDETRAKGGSGIYRFLLDPNETKAPNTPFIDGNTEPSHEYFPSFDVDGKWVSFSACHSSEHSHLSAPYDIFIQSSDLSGAPFRITNNGFTNRWPKLIPSNSLVLPRSEE